MVGVVFVEKDVRTLGSLFVYSDKMARFDFGPDHPFKPERATKAYDLCNRYGVMNYPWMTLLDPPSIGQKQLTLFHNPAYIRLLKEASGGEVRVEMLESGLGNLDNPILRGIYESF